MYSNIKAPDSTFNKYHMITEILCNTYFMSKDGNQSKANQSQRPNYALGLSCQSHWHYPNMYVEEGKQHVP